jgi:HK97 family phage major capsid protein
MVLAAKTLEDLTKSMSDINAQLTTMEARQKASDSDTLAAIFRGSQAPVGRSSDESRALKFFGASSPAQLLNVNTGSPRFKHVPAEVKQVVIDLKESVNTARFIAQQFHGEPLDKIGAIAENDRVAKVKGMLDTNYGRNELSARLKAFGSTVSGGGDEWVPTLLSSAYIEEYQLARVVEDKFQEIPMASNPYEMPTQSGVTKARIIAENTQMTGANFTTGKMTYTATKLSEYYIIPEELNEDSAPAIYQLGTREVVEAQRRAVEAAILNGDNDGTHIDSDTQALGADVAEKAWKGLRRQALANTANGGTTDFSNGVVTEAGLRTMRQRMKKFGVNPSELIFFVDPVTYNQMMVLTNVSTIEKYGAAATIVTGELGRYQGVPIVISEYMRSDLNATGVYDGVTVNRAGLLLVNMRRWYIGMRRPIRVKIQEDLPGQDRWLLASYQRKDFQGFAQSATEVSVSYGLNVSV